MFSTKPFWASVRQRHRYCTVLSSWLSMIRSLSPLFLLFPLLVVSAVSQDIRGVVLSADQTALRGASVRIVQLADTTIVKGAFAGQDGSFIVKNVPDGRYKATLRYVGYKQFDTVFVVNAKDVLLGTLYLQQDSTTTNAVNVEALAERVRVDGDTTSYNANSFKTTPKHRVKTL